MLVEALPALQYDAGHLPGAANLPGDLDEAAAVALAPDKTMLVVTYCAGLPCLRARVANCLDVCEHANVVVVHAGSGRGMRPVWLGGILDAETTGQVTAWVYAAGRGSRECRIPCGVW